MTAMMAGGEPRVLEVTEATALRALLAAHATSPAPLVLRLTVKNVPLSDVEAALSIWAECCDCACGVALVLPSADVAMARSVGMDLAMQGAVVGIFSEPDLPYAVEHALREMHLAAGQRAWNAARDIRFQQMLSTIISNGRLAS